MLTSILLAAAVSMQPAAAQDYAADGEAALAARLAETANVNRARNVILFVGDGMGVSTVTAARILEGQQRGVDGESNFLSFERFPYTALSKTYSHDMQVSDSAATATAMLTGVKTRSGMVGVRFDAEPADCGPRSDAALKSLAADAEEAGKATGVVSTARLTHATPASVYANAPERDWESDDDLPDALVDVCDDIALQLIEWPFGDGLDVAMGGGRRAFLPEETADPEHDGQFGNRLDRRDLTAEWLSRGNRGVYAWNRAQFDAIEPTENPRVLALFEPSHMQFEADRADDPAGEPSLAEMTEKAIEILSRDEDGFFLLVEGGRIDHAHHGVNAHRALTDAIAFAEAVDAARAAADPEETLIIVTADHSHTMTIAGYPSRGNPILGLAASPAGPQLAMDGKPYTTLGYINGPNPADGSRADLAEIDTTAKNFQQQVLVPRGSETHAGEDVAVYATGPFAHLMRGVVDQNYIYFVMRHALDPEADE